MRRYNLKPRGKANLIINAPFYYINYYPHGLIYFPNTSIIQRHSCCLPLQNFTICSLQYCNAMLLLLLVSDVVILSKKCQGRFTIVFFTFCDFKGRFPRGMISDFRFNYFKISVRYLSK